MVVASAQALEMKVVLLTVYLLSSTVSAPLATATAAASKPTANSQPIRLYKVSILIWRMCQRNYSSMEMASKL